MLELVGCSSYAHATNHRQQEHRRIMGGGRVPRWSMWRIDDGGCRLVDDGRTGRRDYCDGMQGFYERPIEG